MQPSYLQHPQTASYIPKYPISPAPSAFTIDGFASARSRSAQGKISALAETALSYRTTNNTVMGTALTMVTCQLQLGRPEYERYKDTLSVRAMDTKVFCMR
jgi:hypothetical protein